MSGYRYSYSTFRSYVERVASDSKPVAAATPVADLFPQVGTNTATEQQKKRRVFTMKELNQKGHVYIRARETCSFMPLHSCSQMCGHWSQDGSECALMHDVPAGERPRDWYLRMLSEVAR